MRRSSRKMQENLESGNGRDGRARRDRGGGEKGGEEMDASKSAEVQVLAENKGFRVWGGVASGDLL